jgi:hypothetical protein
MAARMAIRDGFLPTPAPDLGIEEEFNIAVPEVGEKTSLFGFMDCVIPPRGSKRATTCDAKFTKNAQYAMNADELRVDVQAIGYSHVMFKAFPEIEEVEARWLYMVASGPDEARKAKNSFKVSTILTREHVDPLWGTMLEDMRQMRAIKIAAPKSDDVEPNALACDNYGGCEFRGTCKIEKGQRLVAHLQQFEKTTSSLTVLAESDTTPIASITKESTTMSLSDRLNANKKNGVAPHAPAPQPPPAATAPAAATAAATAAPAAEAASPLLDRLKKLTGAKGVNPPEQSIPAPAPAATAPTPAPQAAAEEDAEDEFEAVPTTAAPAAAPAPAAEAPKAARAPAGEPRKTYAKGLEEGYAKGVAEAVATNGTALQKSSGMIVLMDSLYAKANGNAIKPLIEVLAPCLGAVAKHEKVQHWSLSPNGAAMLARAFDLYLVENGFDGTILVDTHSAEARAVHEVLTARAHLVIRGVR